MDLIKKSLKKIYSKFDFPTKNIPVKKSDISTSSCIDNEKILPQKNIDGIMIFTISFLPSSIIVNIPVRIHDTDICDINCYRYDTFDLLRKDFLRIKGYGEDFKILFKFNNEIIDFTHRLCDYYDPYLYKR